MADKQSKSRVLDEKVADVQLLREARSDADERAELLKGSRVELKSDEQSRLEGEVLIAIYEAERDRLADEAEQKANPLTVKIDVDVSEALTGLKAVERQAKKATQALKEVEAATYGKRIADARGMLAIQGESGNFDYDEYMHGMYNGMEIVLATIENREPAFRDAPAKFIASHRDSKILERVERVENDPASTIPWSEIRRE